MNTVTVTLESKQDSVINNILMLLSSFKGLKVKKKKEYSETEIQLINSLKELKAYQNGEIELDNAEDFLKTL